MCKCNSLFSSYFQRNVTTQNPFILDRTLTWPSSGIFGGMSCLGLAIKETLEYNDVNLESKP